MSDEIVVDVTENNKEGGVAAELSFKSNIFYSCVGHQNEVISVGGIFETRPKSEPFVFIGVVRDSGPTSVSYTHLTLPTKA